MKYVISAARKLAHTVGKSAVGTVISVGRFVRNLLNTIPTGLQQLRIARTHILTGFTRKLKAGRAKSTRVLIPKLRNVVTLFCTVFA